MITSILILVLASLFASGILFKHQRYFTYLSAAGLLFEGHWFLMVLLGRTVFLSVVSDWYYLIGSIVILLLWGTQFKHWSPVSKSVSSRWWREATVGIVLFVVLISAGLVLKANSWNSSQWVMHGFYNGDTATFLSLTQRSLLTDGLVKTSPFAAGTNLEYPTLIHGSVASLVATLGISLESFLSVLVLTQIVITVPVFFLLFDVVCPETKERWKEWCGCNSRKLVLSIQAILVLYVLSLSWEGFVYLQSHFFIIGLFVLQVAILAQARKIERYLLVAVASLIAIVLMFSNAITGTVAVMLISLFYLLQVIDSKKKKLKRVLYALGIPVWIILFFLFTPGNSSFGLPGFSYTSALNMLYLAPIVIVLIITVISRLSSKLFLGSAMIIAMSLAFVVFFFSTRNIVIENATRFFYHGILIGFPFLLYALVRGYYVLSREVRFVTHSLFEKAIFVVLGVVFVLIFILPAGGSVLSAHDNLMFKNKTIVDASTLEAMRWIRNNTDKDSIIIASPDLPWNIPIFTGRALLRTNYWLSPQDDTLSSINKAFSGGIEDQEQIVQQADYLFLTSRERNEWKTVLGELVFENRAGSIYAF